MATDIYGSRAAGQWDKLETILKTACHRSVRPGRATRAI